MKMVNLPFLRRVTKLAQKFQSLVALIFVLTIFQPLSSIAGTILMKNGTVTTSCSDYFYDSGGSSGSYGTSENYTITIYPSTPGAKVTVDFTSFYLENYYDYLYVYDGSSTAASLIGSYTGSTGPGTVTSTAADGTLTFNFTSDGSVTYSGWEASVSCGTLSACSGSVTAGTAVVSASTLCSGTPLSLLLTGFTAASGISYQWQESTTGTGSWTNISGATTMPYVFYPSLGTKYYRCYTVCSASSTSDTSTTVTCTVSGAALPYFEDFESTAYGDWPDCTDATYKSPYGDGMIVYDYGSYPSSLDNHTPGGSNYLYAGYYTGMYSPDYFFTPGFYLETGKTYQFSFWYNTDGYGPYTMGAYMGTDQSKAAMTTALSSDISPNNTTYQQYTANFTVATNATYFFGIKIQETTW